ncbi:RHS repeat-associated core domain-containing protein [Pseudomonas capeferrum]|uniref:RHS repeat domain-containing protein n=1 Tax=Pseudomonas capeferrum TaxID=1495066 RepID=UPI0015E463B4|nr:RHS repeat-associated core domain-containing protein [Pseudomonas capeferrum]MBA1205055.1 RHS repeat-associated core domain-containing protein [Pseudomonas capeferrum]
MPRVTQHLNHPGHGQPSIDTRYTYSADGHNFLGGNAALEWKDDGLDNLFRKALDYDYGTTETLWVDGKPVRSIARSFNKFHLITTEATCHGSQLGDDGKTVVGNNIHEQITTYNLRSGLFVEQPNNCQLPHNVQTRWRLRDNATRNRSEYVSSTYDDYGNLLTHKAANGVVETFTWYKAEEEGYPGNDQGFVRHLKQTTVTPAAGHPRNAPTLTTRYRYQRLPVLASSIADSGQEHWLARQSETLASGDDLNTISYSYWSTAEESAQPDKPMLHGRLRTQLTTFPNPAADEPGQPKTLDTRVEHAYTYETVTWDTLGELIPEPNRNKKPAPEWFRKQIRVLQTEQTTQGFDASQKATAQGFSLQTGEMLLDLDEDKVARFTEYDTLGRITRQVVAPGGESEAVRSEAHYLCASEQEQAYQRSTDSQGVITETRFDGLGRIREERRSHIDPERPTKQILALSRDYDAWGRESKESQHDWLDGLPYPAPEQLQTTEYRYDGWGERSMVLRADGVQEHVSYDPTQTDKDNNVLKTRWLQVPGQTLKSEKVSTWINVFEKPVLIERLDLDDVPVAEQKLTYDGLGRCVSKTDERGHATGFEYDVFGRMTANLLPDESRIERTYAAHTVAELPVRIVVITNKESEPRYEVGTQAFDGLGRLVSRTVGKRLEQYLHVPGQSAPQSMVTGANNTIEYGYKLELSPLPTLSKAIDEEATYEYHPVTSLLMKASNARGDREYQYNLNNQLTHEHWVQPDGKRLTTTYVSSVQGRLVKRTDAGEIAILHEYDERTRLRATTQGNVHAGFEYDLLGRLCQVTSSDQANKSTLTTLLDYDEHGRENRRTQLLDGQSQKTLLQEWGKDGLLDARLSREGKNILLKEKFTYDSRGRLTIVEYSGLQLPKDNEDREVKKQVFRFDSLDNITLCMTTFPDGSSETARYTYELDDRCQLAGLSLTRAGGGTTELAFAHDLNGNLQIDERGNELSYDSQNRLLEIGTNSRYRYDGQGQLLTSTAHGGEENLLWFEGDRLSLAIQGSHHTRYCFHADTPLAQQTDDPAATLLLQTSASHSVIAECQAGTVRGATYGAYGQQHAAPPLRSHLGFNGEALDQGSGWYLLGRGYRAYNPVLMRFNSPDSESPFDSGGLNPYAYCLGNPISLRDPTGHAATGGGGRPRRPDEDDPNWLGRKPGTGGVMKWVWVGIAVVATIAAVVTAGASLAAVGAFGAGAAAAVSSAGTAVAAGAQVGLGTAFLAKFAGTTVTAAIMSTATAALAVGGAAAQTVAAATNNQNAGDWAGYLGLASIGLGVLNAARSIGGMAVSAYLSRNGSVAGGSIGRGSLAGNPLAGSSAMTGAPEQAAARGMGGGLPRNAPPPPELNVNHRWQTNPILNRRTKSFRFRGRPDNSPTARFENPTTQTAL